MKFQVPQFIEVEDKIFGPLTLKQFIYTVGGAGLSVIFYVILPFYIAVFFIVPVMTFSLALAFYKFNNKPFIFVVEAAVKYVFTSKLYIWRREERLVIGDRAIALIGSNSASYIPKMTNSRLKELTWTLDTKNNP